MEAGRELSRQFTQQIALLNAKSELQRTLLQLQQQEEDGILRIKETAAASQQADLIKQQQLVTQLEQLKAIDEFTKSQTQSAVDLVEQTKQLVANDARRKELIAEGLNPALAESFVQIEQQFDKQRELLDATLLTLETELAREGVNGAIAEEIQGQIDKIKELKGELDKAEGDQKKSAEGEKTGKIQDYMNKLQEQLADTEGMVVSLAQTVEGEIGSAMSNAITGLIDGTMTAEQAFSQMFKNIGKAFIDMATQMIAKALILKALGILFPGSSGAGGFGGFSGAGPFSQAGGWNFEGPGMAGFGANMSFMAEGGYVTGPTNALIGEGGEPEYVIPESKMGTAMSRWNEGARGDSILEGGSGSGGSDSGLNLSMSFQTTQFMDREWVDRQQLEAAMAQASARGAKQGEAATLRRLQMSAATRRKLGF
jgi:hypothetical protein